MSMSILFLFLFCAFGLTCIIVHGQILDILKIRALYNKIEFFKKLFSCSLCTGWWVGLLLGIIYFDIKYIIPFSFASSGFCFFLERFTILLDDVIIKINH
jgi:hypothetical protein